LSQRTGKRYRLPTEAEWEEVSKIAAAGKKLDDVAWHAGNAGGTTHPVAKKAADALGLYDLFGNAAEWVTVTSGRPAVRGGSFRDAVNIVGPLAKATRADAWNERDPQIPQSRWWMSDAPFVGFRIVREP
jgi:formylglycine-generating enzyme required for sulfatase activity